MRESILKLMYGPKPRPVSTALRKDLEIFLAAHQKSVVLDGNRYVLVDGDGRLPSNRILETQIAPLVRSLAYVDLKRDES